MPALIFDCDGVLADTELHGHLPAFNATFEEFGIDLRWTPADYAHKLSIGGGKERVRSSLTPEFLAVNPDLPSDEQELGELVTALHLRKTEIYTSMIATGAIDARPGVRDLAQQASDERWQLAVASTSAVRSVEAVLTHAVGDSLATKFRIFAGDSVGAKKPAPDIYELALHSLGIAAGDAVAIEDSGIGLASAHGAGIATIVTPSDFTGEDDFSAAAIVISELGPNGTVIADPLDLAPTPPFGLGLVRHVLESSSTLDFYKGVVP